MFQFAFQFYEFFNFFVCVFLFLMPYSIRQMYLGILSNKFYFFSLWYVDTANSKLLIKTAELEENCCFIINI